MYLQKGEDYVCGHLYWSNASEELDGSAMRFMIVGLQNNVPEV